MSEYERTGERDLSYSAWHRTKSIARYVGWEAAQALKLIDQDVTLYLELDTDSREPLALIETALDVGQGEKATSSMARLAARAGLPAYTVLYRKTARCNPADFRMHDIDRFRVKRVWPSPELVWRTLSPAEWAKALLRIRGWSAAKIEAANDPTWEPLPSDPIAARAVGAEDEKEKTTAAGQAATGSAGARRDDRGISPPAR